MEACEWDYGHFRRAARNGFSLPVFLRRSARALGERIHAGGIAGSQLRDQHPDFTANDHDVQDGCVTPGSHKIMRFDFLSYNAGNSDLVIGSPASRPDLFVWSAGHGHYHLRDFNEFLLDDRKY